MKNENQNQNTNKELNNNQENIFHNNQSLNNGYNNQITTNNPGINELANKNNNYQGSNTNIDYSNNSYYGNTNNNYNNNTNINDNKPINIADKILEVKLKTNEEISIIPEYQLLVIYYKLSQKILYPENHFYIFQNKFFVKDITLTGFITKNDLIDILDDTIVFSDKDLETILSDEDIICKEDNNLYLYKNFLNKIVNFKEEDIFNYIKNYNLDYNEYIIKLRKVIEEYKININDLWNRAYIGEVKCNKKNFWLLFKNDDILVKEFNLLEIDYIYSLFKEDDEILELKEFLEILNRKPDIDKKLYYQNQIEKKLNDKSDNNIENNSKSNENKNLIQEENENKSNNFFPTNNENNLQKEEEKKNNENYNSQLNNESQINKNTILDKIDIKNNIENNDITNYNFKSNNLIFKPRVNTIIIEEDSSFYESKNLTNKNKVNFQNNEIAYKISNIRNNNKMDELNYAPDTQIDNILSQRFEDSNKIVYKVLRQHEKYVTLKLYSILYTKFYSMLGNLEIKFHKKDISHSKLLQVSDCLFLLTDYGEIDLNENELKFLLKKLDDSNDNSNLYNFDTFLKYIFNFNFIENGDILKIEHQALIYFNLYMKDFQNFINLNEIDIEIIFNRFSNNKNYLLFSDFISFCHFISYILYFKEYKLLFDIISNNKDNITLKDLYECTETSQFPSEIDFINKGKIKILYTGTQNYLDWTKNIMKYGETMHNYYLKKYSCFSEIFKLINEKKIKYGIFSYVDFFDASNLVNSYGDIYKNDFREIMAILLGINENTPQLNELIKVFENYKDITKFKLGYFLGIYEIFYPNQSDLNIMIKSELTNSYINYLNKNNFTEIEMKKIKMICCFLCELIHKKKQKVGNYFYSFDIKNKQIFTFDGLKFILFDDLEIDVSDDRINMFLFYLLEENRDDGHYIIKIDKLTKTILSFAGIRNEDNKLKNRKIKESRMNITDDNIPYYEDDFIKKRVKHQKKNKF